MNSLWKAVAVTALGCLISIISGCASSNLVDIWHDASFKTPPLNKMLVIAVRKDATRRRIWEDAFTGELAKHGVMATASYSLFPDAVPDTNQVIATVQANGFDGILVVLRLPMETNTKYIQGFTTIEQNMGNITYWPRYWARYYEIEYPGYIDTQKVAMSAIDVTTTGNGRLIWSATSRTPDPASATDIQQGIAGLVMSKLAQRNIISPKK